MLHRRGARPITKKVRSSTRRKKAPNWFRWQKRAPTVCAHWKILCAAKAATGGTGELRQCRFSMKIAAYIDWSPFFQTWDLAGSYPAILKDENRRHAATKVFAEASVLKKIIEGRWVKKPNGVYCVVSAQQRRRQYRDLCRRSRSRVLMTYHALAPQRTNARRQARNYCRADFYVRPKDSRPGSNYIRLRSPVTAAASRRKKRAKPFENQTTTTTHAIMSDRRDLADSFAEAQPLAVHMRL